VIGIVRGGFGEGGGLNFAISTNAILEALNESTQDHPNGFVTGVTNDVELRSKEEIAKDEAAGIRDLKPGDKFIEIDPVTMKPIQKAQSAGNLWLPKLSVPNGNP
jgi:hypothetical protein